MKSLNQKGGTSINFEAQLYNIDSWTILRLPEKASKKLSTRAMTIVDATINNSHFKTPLEPDGIGSHWFKFTKEMQETANAKSGDNVSITIEQTNNWPDPEMPDDLKIALEANPKCFETWEKITPNAKWDWIRWIRATKNEGTRAKRIEVALSKMKCGMRRPCCFNRNACTIMEVSKNGQLLIPN